MNSTLLSALFFLTIISQIYGRVVNFSLLTFGKKATVTFNGKTLNMLPVDTFSGVQKVAGICPDEEFEYTYTVDGKADVTRKLPKGVLTTHNEFIGRKDTVSPLKGMGYPADKPIWKRSIGKTELFDDSYIPTVILDKNAKEFFSNPYQHDQYTFDRFTIVLKDKIYSEEKVLSKSQNRYEDKFQFRVRLENKIHKRRVFKFRANSVDPAFFRQSLYGDMAAAVNNPVHNQIIVRVYLEDGTAIGLYLMIEVTSSKSFIKSQFYGSEETGKIVVPETGLGYPLDCSTGADFIEGSNFSAFQYSEGENNKKIKYLTEAMHDLDVKDEAAVKKFSKEWLDLDTFFKALALEYLTGDWDSYWMYTTNFVMYDAPEESTDSTYKYYFIDQDFDLTFGLGLSDKVNLWGKDFPSQSYKTLVDRTWNVGGSDGPNRAAIDIFLKGGVTTKMFEQHLIDIVKHVFNPVACGRRLDEYKRRYGDEIKWDYELDRLYTASSVNATHERYVWTYDDFLENLEDSEKESTKWGLKEWIKMRAEAVAEEFNFKWDETPLDPVPRPKKIVKNDDDGSNLKDDDEDMDQVRSAAISFNAPVQRTLYTFVLMAIAFAFFM